MDVTRIIKYINSYEYRSIDWFKFISKCRLLRNRRKNMKKISVFKTYVSQLRISLVTTGSDAVKNLLIFFKRLSDEIGSMSHTCLGSIKIQNYVSEFLLKSEHLFFSQKTKNLFYFLGTWPLYTFEKGVKGIQIGILNSMRAHQYTRTIPLSRPKYRRRQM